MKLVFNTEETATMLGCSTDVVEQRARSGELPGLQFGRGWVFPCEALDRVLNDLALESMATRKQPKPANVTDIKSKRRVPPPL